MLSLFYLTHSQFPDDAVFPLIEFCHQGAVAAKPAEPEIDEMLWIVDDGIGGNEEMAIVCNLILHEWSVLEMSVERLLLFHLPMIESNHIQLVI